MEVGAVWLAVVGIGLLGCRPLLLRQGPSLPQADQVMEMLSDEYPIIRLCHKAVAIGHHVVAQAHRQQHHRLIISVEL